MKALTRCRPLHSLAVGATLAALFVTAGAESSEAESHDAKAPLIKTSDGPVQGIRKHGVYQYLGIPYAAPPVGDLRWRPPQPPKKWAKPLNAGRPGKSCVQSNTLGVFAEPSLEEDCLYLNVVTDDDRNKNGKKNKPVMVWIHGGGWFDGSANEYNSEWLVKRGDVVFVSMNYRLNIFGFFDHPGLAGKNAPSGNYGFMDQQFALRWIKKNIANFGGDPHNVTIFGESAGGGSVMAQIVSPAAKGLFHRAIIESGSYVMVSPMQTVDQAHAYAEQFSDTVGCGGKSAEETAACLKSLTPKQIVKRGKAFTDTAQPIIDGTTIPASIPEVLGSGKFNKVPVMNGANRDELRWFVSLEEAATGHVLTKKEYPERVVAIFGNQNGQRILSRYDIDDFDSPSEALGAVQGDQRMLCPVRTLNAALAEHVPVYSFEFADRTAPDPGPEVSFPLGAAHTLEIQYLFKNYNGATGQVTPLNKQQSRLSDAMVSYWTRFAANGDPNGPDTPEWDRYDSKEDKHLSLNLPMPAVTKTFSSRHRCKFWDNLSAGRIAGTR